MHDSTSTVRQDSLEAAAAIAGIALLLGVEESHWSRTCLKDWGLPSMLTGLYHEISRQDMQLTRTPDLCYSWRIHYSRTDLLR